MRIAHTADLHLGMRQYERTNARGANQREADIAEAVHRCITDMIAAQPDVVLIAGDVFHSIRPTNRAILVLFAELQRLRGALPVAPIIAISGNHDTSRTAEAVSILGLYQALGVSIVHAGIARLPVPGGLVTCVPSACARHLDGVRPDPAYPLNILLLHGAAGAAQYRAPDVADEHLVGWSYVALGDYHVASQVGPRAWYPGSLDYVSSDPWAEVREQATRGLPGKGWLLVELGAGEPVVTFQPIAPARPYLDLERIDAATLGAAEVDAALAARFGAIALDGAVVRIVVENISRLTAHALDHAALRRWKGQALQLRIDWRRPVEEAPTPAGRAMRRLRLDELVDDMLAGRALPPDVDREKMRALGQAYLRDAGALEDPYSGQVAKAS